MRIYMSICPDVRGDAFVENFLHSTLGSSSCVP